jgi:hypothetical protein
MASIVDDDIDVSDLADDGIKKLRVGLTAAKDLDSTRLMWRLVIDIKTEDAGMGKICAPHPQRVPTFPGIVLATDADFEKVDGLSADPLKDGLIMLRVPMPIPLIGSVKSRQSPQVPAVQKFYRAVEDPRPWPHLKFQEPVLDPLLLGNVPIPVKAEKLPPQ